MGGAAALAVQTGAALLPAILWYRGRRLGVHIGKEIPVPAEGNRRQKVAAMMQELARFFEAGIRAHPADWHMLQRVFVADLDPEPAGRGRRPGRGRRRQRRAEAGGDEGGPGQGGRAGEKSAWSARTPGTCPAACRSTSGAWPRP